MAVVWLRIHPSGRGWKLWWDKAGRQRGIVLLRVDPEASGLKSLGRALVLSDPNANQKPGILPLARERAII